jgi:hypothetical protein
MRPVDDARTPVPTFDGDTTRGVGPERRTAGGSGPVTTTPRTRTVTATGVAVKTRTDPAIAIPPRTRTDPAIAVPAKTRTRTDPALAAVPAPIDAEGDEDVIVLAGTPEAQAVTGLIGERLARGGLRRLVIDLDPAELLGDELAPVLRRACAAAGAAGIVIALRTTRPGARRWLSRHGLPEEQP